MRQLRSNLGVAQLLTKVGIVRFLCGIGLLLCGSALGFYLGGLRESATPSPHRDEDPFDFAAGRPIDAARAWRIYFEARREARAFVADPKPHPFFVAAAFAIAGTAVLGVGGLLATQRPAPPSAAR